MKRLRLASKKNSKLLGVCGGLAFSFGMDPTVTRVLWVLLTFFSVGTMAIIYLFLYVIMPKN